MSPVVSGYEQHKSVTALFWAHNASLGWVGTHEVIQPAIDCTSCYDLFNDAQVVYPSVSQSQDQFHLILDPRVDTTLFIEYESSVNLYHTYETITVCYLVHVFLSTS